MKKNEVKVGQTYRCKVSGSLADVRITGENVHGGWDGVNVLTNRKVRVKSAQRLRGKTPQRPAKRSKIVSLAKYEAEAAAEANAPSASRAKKASKATGKAKAAPKRDTGERGAKGAKRTSGLDAAAQVLAEAKEPLNAKEMVERMLAKGLWQTAGKTPAATIYAAIIREIAAKGADSRFRKVERGKFAVSPKP